MEGVIRGMHHNSLTMRQRVKVEAASPNDEPSWSKFWSMPGDRAFSFWRRAITKMRSMKTVTQQLESLIRVLPLYSWPTLRPPQMALLSGILPFQYRRWQLGPIDRTIRRDSMTVDERREHFWISMRSQSVRPIRGPRNMSLPDIFIIKITGQLRLYPQAHKKNYQILSTN